jgi:hypothetical protein
LKKEFIMKKGISVLWLIGILVTLVVSCSGPAKPVSMATPNCDQGFSQLSIGQTITVVEVDHPNRVRSTPHVTNENIIGVITNGQYAKIVDGPVCLDGLVFWKIQGSSVPTGSGWTAEGDGKTHWLTPYQP